MHNTWINNVLQLKFSGDFLVKALTPIEKLTLSLFGTDHIVQWSLTAQNTNTSHTLAYSQSQDRILSANNQNFKSYDRSFSAMIWQFTSDRMFPTSKDCFQWILLPRYLFYCQSHNCFSILLVLFWIFCFSSSVFFVLPIYFASNLLHITLWMIFVLKRPKWFISAIKKKLQFFFLNW